MKWLKVFWHRLLDHRAYTLRDGKYECQDCGVVFDEPTVSYLDEEIYDEGRR